MTSLILDFMFVSEIVKERSLESLVGQFCPYLDYISPINIRSFD